MKMNRMLVPVDLHEKADAETLIAQSIELAKFMNSEIMFVNVIDIDMDSPMLAQNKEVQATYGKTAQSQLEAHLEGKGLDDITYKVKVVNGRSYSKIVEVSKDYNADVIVLTAHKPGMKDYLLGMTAARVVRHAECSVIVLRD